MSSMAGGESLYVDIVADASGFRRDLERKLEAASAGARARVRADLDSGSLRTQVRAAAKAAGDGARVRVKAEVDARSLRTQLAAAVREAAAGVTGKVKVGADFDSASLVRQVRDATKAAQRAAGKIKVGSDVNTAGLAGAVRAAVERVNASRPSVTIHADFDADGLAEKVRLATAAASGRVKIDVDIDTNAIAERVRAAIRAGGGGAGGGPTPPPIPGGGGGGGASDATASVSRGFMRVASMATLAVGAIDLVWAAAGGVNSLLGSLTAVAGGLYAIVAAAGPATAALAAVPAGLSVLVQGIGTAVVGFGGLSDAVKGLQENQQKAGGAATALADAQVAAAKRVRTAQRSVESANDSVAASERRIRDARAAVSSAARDVVDAQASLNDAYDASRDSGVQSARAVAAAERANTAAQEDALDARQALTDAYKTAQQRLKDYQLQLSGAALDEEDASLALERAAQKLKDTNYSDATSDLDKRQADLDYREALQRVAEVRDANGKLREDVAKQTALGVSGSAEVVSAQERVADTSQKALDAQQGLADAREQSDDAAIKSQQAIAKAIEGLNDSRDRQVSAEENVDIAQQDAARSAQALSDAQLDLVDAQKQQSTAADNTAASMSTAQRAYEDASPKAQEFAKFLVGDVIPALKDMRAAAQRGLLPGTEDALRKMLILVTPLSGIFEDTGASIGRMFGQLADLTTSEDFMSRLQTAGDDNVDTLDSLGGSFVRLVDIFANLITAGQPVIDLFTMWLDRTTRVWQETSKLNDGNSALEQWFTRGVEVLKQWGRIIDNTVTGIGNINDSARDAGLTLTQSLEDSSANFLTWSRTNATGIHDWFDAIVPVTQSVGRILLDVIGQLGAIASDPSTRRFVEGIETQVGPALGRLSDALMASGASDDLITLLTTLLDMLTALVNAGVFGTFVGLLTDVAEAVKDIAENPIGAKVLDGIAAFAAFAAPIALLAGAFLKVKGALGALGKIPGVGTLLKSLGAAGKAAVGKLGVGGVAGIAGAVVGNVAGDAVADGRNGGRDIGGAALKGAGNGAAAGALVGSIVPGVGTAVGAAVGAGVGGAYEALNEQKNQSGSWSKAFQDINAAADQYLQPVDDWFGKLQDDLTGGGAQGGKTSVWDSWMSSIKDSANTNLNAADGWVSRLRDKLTGGDTSDGDTSVWGSWMQSISDFATEKLGPLGDDFDDIVDKAGTIPDRVMDAVGGLKDRWDKFWSDRSTAANTKAGEARDFVTDRAGEIQDWVKPKLDDFGKKWDGFWDDRRNGASSRIGEARDWVADRAGEIKGKAQPKLDDFGKNWNGFWDDKRNWANDRTSEAGDWARDRVGEIGGKLNEKFPGVKTTWDTFWTGLQTAAKDPVDWVLTNVIDGGIGKAWDALDGLLGGKLGKWTPVGTIAVAAPAGPAGSANAAEHHADGGVLSGYTPGRDVHMFRSATAGNLALSGGEAIMRPEWTRAVGSGFVDTMNRVARSGGVGAVRSAMGGAFADGGVLGGGGPVQRFAGGGLVGLLDFGRELRGLGYTITDNKALGSNPKRGDHAAGGWHYKDDNSGAIDINAGAGTSLAEQLKLAPLVPEALKRGLSAIFFAKDGSHRNHLHVDEGTRSDIGLSAMPKEVRAIIDAGDTGGLLASIGNAVSGVVGSLPGVGAITSAVSGISTALKGIGGMPGTGTTVGKIAAGAAGALADTATGWLTDKATSLLSVFTGSEAGEGRSAGGSFGGGSSGGVEKWRATGLDALKATGSPAEWIDSMLRRMKQESGGDPDIVNKWDSNWKKGTPSVGLMQVIGPTYKRWIDKAHDVGPYSYGTSVNPLANIIASIGYANDRYGTAQKGWDRKGGYAAGGILDWFGNKVGDVAKVFDNGGWLMPGDIGVNHSSKPEPIFTGNEWPTIKALVEDGPRGGGTSAEVSQQLTELLSRLDKLTDQVGVVNVYPQPRQSEEEIGRVASSRMAFGLRR